jgi:glutamate decarboxylase
MSKPDDDLYASSALRIGAPKDRMPDEPRPARAAYQLVHDELLLDGAARTNLATFCTTWVEPEVTALLTESYDRNMVDKDEYPRTAELEARCVRMLADLWHAPDAPNAIGTSTTGSSEAAMLGGLAARARWRARRGTSAGQPNLVCGPVQVCWEKFARYFDVELREAPMTATSYTLTPEQVLARCDENTIAVVVTLGQTFTGLFEDVVAISAALDDLQERTGLDIPIHVDGASGALLAAFCAPDLPWDFRNPRVRSINASGHKTGLAPLGCGWAIWRERSDLPDELIFEVNYLGGSVPTFNLNFSRPGNPVIAQYYTLTRLGRGGYRDLHMASYETAGRIASAVADLGPFEIVFGGDPLHGIAAVAWKLTDEHHAFNLFDVAEGLRSRGWLVPAYTLPPDLQELPIQRALVRHGFSADMADLLLDDLRRTLDGLHSRPPSRPLTAAEGGGFNHDATPVVPLRV